MPLTNRSAAWADGALPYLNPLKAAVLVVLIALTPAASVIRGGASGVLFYVLILASLLVLLTGDPPRRARLAHEWPAWRALAVGAGLFVLVMAVVQAGQGSAPGAGMEKTLRFALAAPLVLALRQVDPRHLMRAQWGLIVTALALAVLLIFPPAVSGTRPDTVQFSRYNTVEFGNLACLLAALSFFSCGWRTTRYVRTEVAIKVLVGLLSLYGFLLSQTRTGWLAVPVFLAIGLAMALGASRRTRIGAVVVLAGFVAFTAFSADGLHARFRLAFDELAQCEQAPLTDSSICIRMQLATAATHLFRQAPLVGVGDGEAYRAALHEQQRQGVVSGYVAENFGEPHNDFLFYLSAYGLLGVIGAVFFIYLLPAWYFVRAFLGRHSRQSWFAAAMGLSLCLGFAAFGMTEMMFRSMRTASLYAVWLAVFLAVAVHPRAAAASGAPSARVRPSQAADE